MEINDKINNEFQSIKSDFTTDVPELDSKLHHCGQQISTLQRTLKNK